MRMPFLNNVCHLPSPGNLSPGSTLRCVLLILWLQQPLPEKKEGKKKKKKKRNMICAKENWAIDRQSLAKEISSQTPSRLVCTPVAVG